MTHIPRIRSSGVTKKKRGILAVCLEDIRILLISTHTINWFSYEGVLGSLGGTLFSCFNFFFVFLKTPFLYQLQRHSLAGTHVERVNAVVQLVYNYWLRKPLPEKLGQQLQ
jgi:hypothetical protein